MEFNEYQEAAKRTLYGNEQVLTNCALGLAGESGQVVDLVKSYTFKGKPLDKQQLIHEMGDVLWYLSQVAEWADIPFDEVAQANIATLNKRYPHVHANGGTDGNRKGLVRKRCFLPVPFHGRLSLFVLSWFCFFSVLSWLVWLLGCGFIRMLRVDGEVFKQAIQSVLPACY